jgi:hypothetical protein
VRVVLSQPHSRGRLSPKRYENRYDQELQIDRSIPAPVTHENLGVAPRMWGVQDTGYLTSFSVNGEYHSNTLSERRGWLLRASATSSNGWCSRNLTGDCRPSSLTCLQPWLRPLRLSRMTGSLDRLRRRSALRTQIQSGRAS